jgi:hypothetical protein
MIHGKKPRIKRYKVFGCPVIFKQYQPHHNGDLKTKFKQLQRGSRGNFVGFPKDQVGWLIYVPEKIGDSYLIVSMDVVFDQHFMSGITGTRKVFNQGQMEKNVGKVGGRKSEITETTGDLTNLMDSEISHWGQKETFQSEHKVVSNKRNENHFKLLQSDGDSDDSKVNPEIRNLVEKMNKDFENNEINVDNEDSIPPLKPYDIDENDSSDDEDEDKQKESDDDFYEPTKEHKIDLILGCKKINRI